MVRCIAVIKMKVLAIFLYFIQNLIKGIPQKLLNRNQQLVIKLFRDYKKPRVQLAILQMGKESGSPSIPTNTWYYHAWVIAGMLKGRLNLACQLIL